MVQTFFNHFTITFADASSPDVQGANQRGYSNCYHLLESSSHRWTIFDSAQLVTMTNEQHEQLAALLSALHPLPNSAVEQQLSSISDGTWFSVDIQHANQQTAYQWFVQPPVEWQSLDAITQYVEQLADIPHEQRRQQEQKLAHQFFRHLANRDLPGMMTCYHPEIRYRNPFIELQGDEVATMWQMGWRCLPDVQVLYKDSDIRVNFAYWQAVYIYPPTGRCVKHRLSTTLTFAEGKIIQQIDYFDLHEWAEQSYGCLGKIVGGWKLFKNQLTGKMRAKFAASLNEP
jgi:ketosteroid isomerase-like protein